MNEMTIQVPRITLSSRSGRVLATAFVRIDFDGIFIKTGPWRVLDRDGTDPVVVAPDVRLDGRWVRTIEMPRGLFGQVESAVLEAWKDQADSSEVANG